jgi:hypothetical protein
MKFQPQSPESTVMAPPPFDPENPYAGPNPFGEGQSLYGRDADVLTLKRLLRAERIVVLHSPSGAGKTSLLRSALIPKMGNDEDYDVLPLIRVGLTPPTDPSEAPRPNRYLSSTVLSLDLALPTEGPGQKPYTRSVTLQAYLEELRDLRGRKKADAIQLLIFDQFEEIFTLDPTDEQAKHEFFAELGVALRDGRRAALFSMREEFLGDLSPYVHLLPTRLAHRYRLELLRPDGARDAIQKPAAEHGVRFDDAAVNGLVDNLRELRVSRPGRAVEAVPGPYVEPVQLQVVCYSLWEKVIGERFPGDHDAGLSIHEADLADGGDVDTILGGYYARKVADVSHTSKTPEREIRAWIAEQLITPGGLRNQVLADRHTALGVPQGVITALVDARLVRAEERRGMTWYEITHDRLVGPIQQNNQQWFDRNATFLQLRLKAWLNHGRSDAALLRVDELILAEQIAAETGESHSKDERDYLERSRSHLKLQRQRRARNRTIVSVIWLVSVLMGLGGLYMYWVWRATTNSVDEIRDLTLELQARSYGEVPRQPTPTAELDGIPPIDVIAARPYPADPQTFGVEEIKRDRAEADRFLALLKTDAPGSMTTINLVLNTVSISDSAAEKLRDFGFEVDPSNYAGKPDPNILVVGDSVPDYQVKALALTLISKGIPIRRVRRFNSGERTYDLEPRFDMRFDPWPQLTARDVMNLRVAASASRR